MATLLDEAGEELLDEAEASLLDETEADEGGPTPGRGPAAAVARGGAVI